MIWSSGAVSVLDAIAEATGKPASAKDYEPLTWGFYQNGKSFSGGEYMMAVAQIQSVSRTVAGASTSRGALPIPSRREA